jgi:PAS domain-containing protein
MVKNNSSVEKQLLCLKRLLSAHAVLSKAVLRIGKSKELLSKRVTRRECINVVKELPLPAFIFNRDQTGYIAANSHFCELLGYSETELITMPWQKAYPDYVVPLLEKALGLDVPYGCVEWLYKRSDGKTLALLTKCRRMKLIDENGKPNNVSLVTILRIRGENEVQAVKYFARVS